MTEAQTKRMLELNDQGIADGDVATRLTDEFGTRVTRQAITQNLPLHGRKPINKNKKDVARHYREEYKRIKAVREAGAVGFIDIIEY